MGSRSHLVAVSVSDNLTAVAYFDTPAFYFTFLFASGVACRRKKTRLAYAIQKNGKIK